MNVKNRLGLGNSQIKQRLGVQPKLQAEVKHTGLPTQQGDARFQLIQKKRQNISDARDRLAEIAKTSDARVKLNKLKKLSIAPFQQNGNPAQIRVNKPLLATPQMGRVTMTHNVKRIGNRPISIPPIKKTIGRGSTTQLRGGALIRTVSGPGKNATTITRTVGRPQQITKKINVNKGINLNAERYHPLPNNPHVVTIRNDSAVKSNQRFSQQPQLRAKRYMQEQQQQQQQQDQAAALRTALTQTLPLMAAMNTNMQLQQMRAFQGNSYQPWAAAPFVQDYNKPANLKITTSNNIMGANSSFENDRYRARPTPRVTSVKRSSYDAHDGNYAFPPPKRQSLSNVTSRLEPNQRPVQSGFKVMVSNLHPRVTDDDIEELFKTIGTIKYARFVREGTAEVMFNNELDAYKSVDVYHNRQLDGQPMNVLVVTPRSGNNSVTRKSPNRSRNSQPQARKSGYAGNSSQSQQGRNAAQKSVLRAAGGSVYGNSQNGIPSFSNKRSQKMDVVAPDLNTIHHALFSGRTPMRMNSNPQVYIKLPRQPMRR